MNRSLMIRGLAVLVSSAAFLMGCGAGTPTEGDLPKTKAGSPEEIAAIQKKLEQEKIAGGAAYKPPPGVVRPSR